MSKTAKSIGLTSARAIPVHILHLAVLASFLFFWFAASPLMRSFDGGSANSLVQAAFMHLPVLLLSIVGAIAGFVMKRDGDFRQPLQR